MHQPSESKIGGTRKGVDSAELSVVSDQQWSRLRQRIAQRRQKHSAEEVFGAAAQRGAVYRWGLACALGDKPDDLTMWLSHCACDVKPPRNLASRVDVAESAREMIESSQSLTSTPAAAASSVWWAAAMPELANAVDTDVWWELLSTLQQLHVAAGQQTSADSPVHLLLAGELGLTLSWRLADLPSCKRLRSASRQAVDRWCNAVDDSIAMSVAGGTDARLVMGSLIRCLRLTRTAKRKRSAKDRADAVASELATWVTALTTHTGSTAFSSASRKDVADDLSEHGLLSHAAAYDRDALGPAMKAALGKSHSGGRLAWQVALPESMHLNDDAKIAVMMPDWDVRRGRIHVDYCSDDVRLETFCGRQLMLAGRWQTIIEVDQDEQHPQGEWELTCEYTDDDVHYLELEQPWSNGVLLQRQFLLIRDDRCLLLSDSVVRSDAAIASDAGGETDSAGNLRYISRIPIADDVETREEEETREIFLERGRNRAMVMPLSALEWRHGLSRCSLETSPDHHLTLMCRGRDRVYAPLWIDFQQRRFKRKRTWRQLTVADERRIVDADTAVGFRIQVGSEQWMLYRSLSDRRCRSVLGKHIVSDFFCGRFDSGDGGIEELITVDDRESFDD